MGLVLGIELSISLVLESPLGGCNTYKHDSFLVFKEERMAYSTLVASTCRAMMGGHFHLQTIASERIDEIDDELAGLLKTHKIVAAVGIGSPEWIRTVAKIFNPESEVKGWCGFNGVWPSESTVIDFSNPRVRKAIGQLENKVLEPIRSKCRPAHIFSRLFLVPKDANLSRVILDCRGANSQCGKPPSIKFTRIEEIFEFFRFFDVTHVVTADFRHWFYQIPLAKGMRGLFSVACGTEWWQLKVWAMGFSWSPFVAQSISMWIGHEAIKGAGFFPLAPTDNQRVPPPFWILTDRPLETYRNLSRERVVGFLTFWYDNLLLVTGDAETAKSVTAQLKVQAQKVHAIWKSKKGAAETDDPHFTATVDNAEFLGIHFERQQGNWNWKHMDKNIDLWRGLAQPTTPTWRWAAQIAGILTWEWTVSNAKRDRMHKIFKIVRSIGKQKLHGSAWDQPFTCKKSSAILSSALEACLHNSWKRQFRKVRDLFTQKIWLATDAMEKRGAAVWLDGTTGAERRYLIINFPTMPRLLHWGDDDEEKEDWSINWKETYSALYALKAMTDNMENHTLVTLATDNTSAAAVLRRRAIPWCDQLERLLLEVEAAFSKKNSDFRVFYVPGIDQAADERSRGKPTDLAKSLRCLAHMKEFDYSWLEVLAISNAHTKRQRAEEV